MTDIRIITKKNEKKVAAYLGLSVYQLRAGMPPEMQEQKYPAIDVDTIIPKLDRMEAARVEALKAQLKEAHASWIEQMNANQATIVHRKALSTGNPICWVDDIREYQAKVTMRTADITCGDCIEIYKAMVNA